MVQGRSRADQTWYPSGILTPVDRVVLVVVDGLRPDAISTFGLYHMARLRAHGASTAEATTVSPGGNWAALTSLMTGVAPDTHGILCAGLQLRAPFVPLDPVPELLARIGLPSSAFLAEIPQKYRVFATRVAERLGFATTRFTGGPADEIVAAAGRSLTTQRRGLMVLHLSDLDLVGHEQGWMSAAYRDAAKRVDMAIGLVAALADVPRDPRTLLVIVSDHGGGGVDPRSHRSSHRLDTTIPLILAGSPMPVPLAPPVSLLDVPATVLYALGAVIPATYGGRPLREAFVGEAAGRAVSRGAPPRRPFTALLY